MSSQLHVYDDCLCIKVVADRLLTDLDRTVIKNKMSTVVDNLSADDVKVVQVEALDKSMAGKVVLVVYHQCNYSD